MAQKITLKRVIQADGSTEDLFPTTSLDQIISIGTGNQGADESLQEYLEGTFLPWTQKAANNGLATLNSSGKLTASQVPDYLFGGLNFEGALSTAQTDAQMVALLEALYQDRGAADIDAMVGSYWVAQAAFDQDLAMQSTQAGTTGRYYATVMNNYVEEGQEDSLDEVTLEAGDWLIIAGVTGTGSQADPYLVNFSVVNNTYRDANSGTKGIVKLSNATNAGVYNASTNTGGLVDGALEVVTENFLFDNIASGEMNGGEAGANDVLNKIASTNHIHDGRYYTETEINNWVAGTASINSKNFTEIKYGSAPSSTTVGTILIDID